MPDTATMPIPDDLADLLDATFADAELVAAVKALTVTESESERLAANLSMLWGRADLVLWPDHTTRLRMESDSLLAAAEQAAAAVGQQEWQAGGPVLRDSRTMMLELIHAAQDPMVLTHNPEGWLWGPVGPPVRLAEPVPVGGDRYGLHAASLDRPWTKKIARMSVRHEVNACKAMLGDATREMENGGLVAALASASTARSVVEPLIAEGLAVAAAHPAGPWPASMVEWSAQAWQAADALADAASRALRAASAAGVVRVLNSGVATNEERGMFVAVEQVRPLNLLTWWSSIAPPRETPTDPSKPDLSFWYAARNPVDFWAACMTAALMELGQSMHGGVEGAALALLNR